MTNITVEIRGLDALVRKYGAGADTIIKAVTRDVAEAIKTQIAVKPPPSHSPVIWASAKQRAWYFWARKRDNLPPQYARGTDDWSKTLEKSWTTENRGLDAVLGPGDIAYAPYVQSKEKQTRQHAATGWVTDEQAIERANVQKAAENALSDALKEW